MEDGVRSGDDAAYTHLFQETISLLGGKDSLATLSQVAAQDARDGKECLLENRSNSVYVNYSVEQNMDVKLARDFDPSFVRTVGGFVDALKQGPLTSNQLRNLRSFLEQESSLVGKQGGPLLRGGHDVADYINQRLKQEGSKNQLNLSEVGLSQQGGFRLGEVGY